MVSELKAVKRLRIIIRINMLVCVLVVVYELWRSFG